MADPFADLGDQTYVDFVALSECVAQGRNAATTTQQPGTQPARSQQATSQPTRSQQATSQPTRSQHATSQPTRSQHATSQPTRSQPPPRTQRGSARQPASNPPVVFNRSQSTPATSSIPNRPANRARDNSTLSRQRSEGMDVPDIPPRPTDPQIIAQGRAKLLRMRKEDGDIPDTTNNDEAPPAAHNRKLSHRNTWAGNGVARIAVVSHSYVPVNSDDLAVKKGDVLEILEAEHHWWWYARNPATGQSGYVPCNHVRSEIPLKHDKGWKVETVISENSTGRYLVHAVGRYDGNNPDEIGCRAGDAFVVLNDNATWWYVRHIKSGMEGFIPSAYLQRYSSSGNGNESDDDDALPEDLGVDL